MVALAGFLGDILITSPPSVALSANYVLTDSGDHQNFTNPVASASQRYWDNTSVPVVQTTTDGVTWNTTTAYTIRYVNGQITLNAALVGASPGVRLASGGKYFPYASVGNTTDWQAQMAVKTIETTTHKGVGGSLWQDWQLITAGGKVTIKKWWIAHTMFNNITNRTLIILSCLTPQGNRFEAYGYLINWQTNTGQNVMVDEALVFQFTNQVYAF